MEKTSVISSRARKFILFGELAGVGGVLRVPNGLILQPGTYWGDVFPPKMTGLGSDVIIWEKYLKLFEDWAARNSGVRVLDLEIVKPTALSGMGGDVERGIISFLVEPGSQVEWTQEEAKILGFIPSLFRQKGRPTDKNTGKAPTAKNTVEQIINTAENMADAVIVGVKKASNTVVLLAVAAGLAFVFFRASK